MSFIEKTFRFSEDVKIFLENKSFQRTLVLFLSFFFIVGFFFNSYSSSANWKYDGLDYYEGSTDLSKAVTGVEGTNSHESQHIQLTDFTLTLLDLTCPQCNSNYASIVADPNLSVGAKIGIIGAIDIPVSAMLYNPPRIDVAEHLAQEWIPNYDQTSGGVYANSGHEMLVGSANISSLWGMVRNIAYMLFVVVFIIAGFMIMFRHKLGGQTMVTVYNTLPNIVVGLVLVTFSFALVGLMLDIGALLIRVVSGVLEISDPIDATDPFGVMSSYIHLTGSQIIQAFTENILALVSGLLFLFMGSLISLLIVLAVIGVIVSASIKIFFTLIKAYVGILFDTIASPLVFVIATIPGQSHVMKDWFNRVAKNVMVFVLVFTLINLPIYFIDQNLGEGFTLFGGDLSGEAGSVGGFGGTIIMMGISIYMLFMAASCPKMLDDYFPQQGKKEGAKAMSDGAKANLAKVPLVGGLFKG